jgi:hypothetical protein
MKVKRFEELYDKVVEGIPVRMLRRALATINPGSTYLGCSKADMRYITQREFEIDEVRCRMRLNKLEAAIVDQDVAEATNSKRSNREYAELTEILGSIEVDSFVTPQSRKRFFTWAQKALDARACLGDGA